MRRARRREILPVAGRLAMPRRFDPDTGDRAILSGGVSTIFAGGDTGTSPAFAEPFGIVVDSFRGAVVRVDPFSGNQIIISGAPIGAGLPFGSPESLVTEATGTLLVADSFLAAVIRVDVRLDSFGGSRAIISK